MKRIFLGYSELTNNIYAFCNKDNSDKQAVTEQITEIIKWMCKKNRTSEIRIGDLTLQIKGA